MLRVILIAAALSSVPALADRTIPVISAHDDSAAYRTTLFVDNGNDYAATCRFTLPDEETVHTTDRYTTEVFPQFLRHLKAPAAVRAACPDDVDLYVRIQTSRDRGRTWDRGRIFVPMAPVTGRHHQMRISSDVVVGESTGRPADVRMIIRRGAVVKTDETVRFEGASLTLMTFGDGESLDPDLTLELEVIAGEGRLAVGEAIRDPRVRHVIEKRERMAMLPKSAPGNMHAAKMLGISPFKAAPFQDPATGLIYMRERWYDPRSGTFLTPDPMGFLDSANTYAYGAGDPVNNSDPTGLALYAFDGTWDHEGSRSGFGRNQSNVWRLYRAYTGANAFYMRGVGNELEFGAFRQAASGFSGLGGRAKVEAMYETLVRTFNYRNDRVIDVIGFSRGAAMALDFLNVIRERGIPIRDAQNRDTGRYFQGVAIRTVGLFDAVGSVGMPRSSGSKPWRLYKPAGLPVGVSLHAVSKDEDRLGYELVRPCGFHEGWFEGGHANVGGSSHWRGLGDVSLRWMAGEANRRSGAGVFDLARIQFQPDQFDYWHNVVGDYSVASGDVRNPFGRGIYNKCAPIPETSWVSEYNRAMGQTWGKR